MQRRILISFSSCTTKAASLSPRHLPTKILYSVLVSYKYVRPKKGLTTSALYYPARPDAGFVRWLPPTNQHGAETPKNVVEYDKFNPPSHTTIRGQPAAV